MKSKETILERNKRILRYSIRVDIEAGIEMGVTIEEAIEWFTTEECAEIYNLQNGKAENGEIFSEVVVEVANEYVYRYERI